MTFDKFLNTYKVGKSYDYNNTGYKGQCVSLIKLYIKEVLGVTPQSIGDAKYYWLNRNSDYIKKNFTAIANTPSFVPQKGDIFVRTSGTYGHVGIVLDATAKYFNTIEQNAGGSKVVSKEKHTDWSNIHFLRPKNRSNIVVAPKVKAGTYELTNVRGIYKGYGVASGRKKVKELTEDGKKHTTTKSGNAYLKAKTKITIKETKLISSGNLWAKIPSGYICIWECDKDKKFIE